MSRLVVEPFVLRLKAPSASPLEAIAAALGPGVVRWAVVAVESGDWIIEGARLHDLSADDEQIPFAGLQPMRERGELGLESADSRSRHRLPETANSKLLKAQRSHLGSMGAKEPAFRRCSPRA